MKAQEVSHTTDGTMTHDLQCSLVKNTLEVAQVCDDPISKHTATFAVSLHERATFDAAIWKGAEFLSRLRYPQYGDRRLIGLPDEIQAECYQHAAKVFHVIRLVLQGDYNRAETEQAAADFYSHLSKLATAAAQPKSGTVVPFTGRTA